MTARSSPRDLRGPRALVLAGAAATLMAAALTACNDGSLPFSGGLGPAPILPQLEQAQTSPAELFTAQGSAFPVPADGYGAEGPDAFVIVPTDDGENTAQQLQMEEGDALVSDPSKNRVLLLKARAHTLGQPPAALVFASVAGARGVAFAEAGGARRALVASASGYVVLRADGFLLSSNAVVGAPFSEIAFAATGNGATLFLAGAGQVVRIRVSADGNFTPQGDVTQLAPAGDAELLFAGEDLDLDTNLDPIRGLFLGANDFLFLTNGNRLRRIGEASSPLVAERFDDSVVVDNVLSFGAEVPGGIAPNSEDNTLVAVSGGGGGRIDEVRASGGTGGFSGSLASTLALTGQPRDVGVDGIHSAIYWVSASGVRPQIEDAPDLGLRLQPIWEQRLCVGCHPTVFPQLDLSTPELAFDTLVGPGSGVLCGGGGGGGSRVIPGNPDISFLVLKLEAPPCGVRMPQGNRPTTTVDNDTIRRWIAAGAVEAAPAP